MILIFLTLVDYTFCYVLVCILPVIISMQNLFWDVVLLSIPPSKAL